MAKIFLSFFSGVNDPNNEKAIPCFYESFIKGLQNSGNEILAFVSKTFNKDFKDIPQDLLKEIQNFNPDFIFLFNNAFYDISSYFECPIFIYEVDSPLYYSNKKALIKNIERYKFICAQEESLNILKCKYKVKDKNIINVPFFSEIQNENINVEQNISFIGTKFTSSVKKSPYAEFMTNQPNKMEIEQYATLINSISKEPFLTQKELFDKFNINSDLIKKNFNTDEIIFYLSDYNRVKTLSCVSDLGLKIYGTQNWINDYYNEPYLILNFDRTPIYSIKHNQDIYNSSKIGININHLQAKQCFSWRVCDIMASGACLVSEYKPDLIKYFPNINLPTFNTPYEARELCIKLIKNENMRKDIVSASNEIINKNFRFINIKDIIEDYFNISLSGEKVSTKIIIEKVDKNKLNKTLIKKICCNCYSKLKRELNKIGNSPSSS